MLDIYLKASNNHVRAQSLLKEFINIANEANQTKPISFWSNHSEMQGFLNFVNAHSKMANVFSKIEFEGEEENAFDLSMK